MLWVKNIINHDSYHKLKSTLWKTVKKSKNLKGFSRGPKGFSYPRCARVRIFPFRVNLKMGDRNKVSLFFTRNSLSIILVLSIIIFLINRDRMQCFLSRSSTLYHDFGSFYRDFHTFLHDFENSITIMRIQNFALKP